MGGSYIGMLTPGYVIDRIDIDIERIDVSDLGTILCIYT